MNFNSGRIDLKVPENNNYRDFIVTIKHRVRGNYLISLRSPTGIEAARVLVRDDSVFINDRINRQFISGTVAAAERKFGIPVSVIPVLFGDYIGSICSDNGKIDGFSKNEIISSNVGVMKLNYMIDSATGRVKRITSSGKNGFEIVFNNYKREGEHSFPDRISVNADFGTGVKTTDIRIKDIDFGNNEELVFVKGEKYESVTVR